VPVAPAPVTPTAARQTRVAVTWPRPNPPTAAPRRRLKALPRPRRLRVPARLRRLRVPARLRRLRVPARPRRRRVLLPPKPSPPLPGPANRKRRRSHKPRVRRDPNTREAAPGLGQGKPAGPAPPPIDHKCAAMRRWAAGTVRPCVGVVATGLAWAVVADAAAPEEAGGAGDARCRLRSCCRTALRTRSLNRP